MTVAALPHHRLRAATRASHDAVDAAYAGFGLHERTGYTAFLIAHARVLVPIEPVLAGRAGLPPFAPRAAALAADLAELGETLPPPATVPAPASPGDAWGMLYVVEGSRLGGIMLARQVGAGLPRAYLASAHPSGAWRRLLAGFDHAAAGPAWERDAVRAARQVFALYADSARGGG